MSIEEFIQIIEGGYTGGFAFKKDDILYTCIDADEDQIISPLGEVILTEIYCEGLPGRSFVGLGAKHLVNVSELRISYLVDIEGDNFPVDLRTEIYMRY